MRAHASGSSTTPGARWNARAPARRTSACSTSACPTWTATNWRAACAREPGSAAATLVALTGYGQEHDRERALEAGFDHYLVKPVDTAALIAVLDGVAKGRISQTN